MDTKNRKQNKEKVTLKLLTESIRGSRRFFVCGFLGAVLSIVAQFISPLVIAFVIDYILLGDTSSFPPMVTGLLEKFPDRQFFLDRLWIPAIALICVTAVTCILSFTRSFSTTVASETTVKNVRDKLYRHLQDLPYDYHKHAMTGDLIQRCTSDVDMVRRFMSMQLIELVRCSTSVVLALVMMFILNSKLALSALVLPPLLLVFSYWYFKRVSQRFQTVDEAEGALSEMLNENVSGVRVVRAFGQQRAEYEKFKKRNATYRQENSHLMVLMGKYWALTDMLSYLQIALILIFAVFMAAQGLITVGTVIIFRSYSNQLTWPVRQLGRVLSDMSKSKVALGRLNEIIDAPVEKEPGAALTPTITGAVSFKNVCFGYDAPDEVLKGVSFEVKAGQTVAVLGSTGSGKSSLMHLISRLYDCTGGSIELDGVKVSDIERHHLRRSIGTVMQEPFLYSRSIIENLRMVCPDATDEQIYAATKSAAIHDTIMSFKDGYDTMVGEKGVTLSGGEKQRLAIARILLQEAPIIIFDDSLSAVDTETDVIIREALKSQKHKATTFIISHRITTLCEADFIIVLENGKVSDSGTHEQLLSRDGLYRRIAEIQAFTQKI